MKRKTSKLRLAILFHKCREKLRVISDEEVWKYLSINGVNYAWGKTRSKLISAQKHKLEFMLEKLLLTEKPKIYPGCRHKVTPREEEKSESSETWAKVAMTQLKKRLINAINADLYCVDLMKEYLALLPAPVDF